jgi:hypothetical protein
MSLNDCTVDRKVRGGHREMALPSALVLRRERALLFSEAYLLDLGSEMAAIGEYRGLSRYSFLEKGPAVAIASYPSQPIQCTHL